MSRKFVAAAIQNHAGPEVGPNLETAVRLSREAIAQGAEFIALPEYFAALELNGPMLLGKPFPEQEHPALPLFADLARETGATFLLGSLAITNARGPSSDTRFVNRAYVIDGNGQIRGRYDKIHLFDVSLANGEEYRESATVRPGSEAVLAPTKWGPLGLSICYDLRFAALYRSLAQQGAEMLAVPAAFTKTTGQAHWHVLLRARAIENGAFVIAPCQFGVHEGGRADFGHSLIVDPWGRVLADGGEGEGIALAEIDLDEAVRVRRMIPSLTHDRPFSLTKTADAAE